MYLKVGAPGLGSCRRHCAQTCCNAACATVSSTGASDRTVVPSGTSHDVNRPLPLSCVCLTVNTMAYCWPGQGGFGAEDNWYVCHA